MAERTLVTKTVAWFLEKKILIKFTDDEKTYKLADNVVKANDFEKFPIRKNDLVEVAFENDLVSYLRKVKSETPKTVASVSEQGKGSEEAYEPTPEEQAPKSVPTSKPEVVGEIKELTIFAVAQNKKVVKFLECKDAEWFQIDPSIQAKDYNEIGLIAKTRAKVQIVENRVISFEKMAVEAPQPSQDKPSEAKEGKVEQTPVQTPTQALKKEWKLYNASEASERQLSIECQACMNSACQVVGMVAASLPQAPTANVLNQMIRAVAEANHQLLQELKKK